MTPLKNKHLARIILVSLLLFSSTLCLAGAASETHKKNTPKKIAKATNDYAFYLKAGDRSPKWNEFIEPGFTTFDNENLATAYVFLNKAFEQGCRDGLVLFRLGIFMEIQKRYPEAAELLAAAAEKIPKQYPGHPLAKGIHEHAGRALYQIDDYARALPELQKAIEHSPDNFMVLFMTGQLLRLSKQYAAARGTFEQAMKATPPKGMEADAKYRLSRELMLLAFELRDFPTCLTYVHQVLAIAPADPLALSYKQKLEYQMKEREVIEQLVK